MKASIAAAASLVKEEAGAEPCDLAVILGSGLGESLAGCQELVDIPFARLPGVPAGVVQGHAGRLLVLRREGYKLLVFQGRFHCYQGLSARQAAFPAELAHALGVRRLLVTSAVGGIAPELVPGTFVLVRDHINLLGDNPLKGEVPPRFVDLSRLYRQDDFPALKAAAVAAGARLARGVLAAMHGPSYETPAEIEMLSRLGADVVSMSMVPEAIMAAACGMQVVGLALVTNPAAGLGETALDHREVLAEGKAAEAFFEPLFSALFKSWFSSF